MLDRLVRLVVVLRVVPVLITISLSCNVSDVSLHGSDVGFNALSCNVSAVTLHGSDVESFVSTSL